VELPIDDDLPSGDRLLGVPLREFMQVRALRGLVLVAISAAILLWPDRGGGVLGILVGLASGLFAATTTIDLLRSRERRRFPLVLSVGITGGFAFALVLHPEESLTSVTQATGGMMVAVAAVTVVLVTLRRHSVAWGIAKSVGLSVGGALLILFPDTLLVAATSIVAGTSAAVGLIEVFTTARDGGARTDRGSAGGGSDLGTSAQRTVRSWIERRPAEAEERQGLRAKLYLEGPDAAVRFARFVTLMVLASVIASVGVVVESTAVVIGAMLIAPLMVPLMGTAYGVTMGWMRRTRRSAGIALVGISTAIATGAVVGSVVPRSVDIDANVEILARIAPTTLDLAIAVAAGAAGAYALSRSDVSDSLPGVAVAISLVPPLTVVGLCWQQAGWAAGNGALLLFLTNAVAILLAGGLTFVLVGATPLAKTSRSRERWSTVVVSVASLGAVVVLLLLLNGASQARREVAVNEVQDVMDDWTEANPQYRLLDTRTPADGTIVVDLVGPGRPPGLSALMNDLRDAAESGTEIRVTWVEQDQVTVTGD
jgi:uncharacterized hydrophobic protein (TIGR00271 family)